MKAKLISTYLYADGHAAQCFEKTDKDAGTIEYVEITEKFTQAHCAFKGRICIGRYNEAMATLFKSAVHIEANEAKVDSGSDNTKRMNIAVGHLCVTFKNGEHLRWTTMPDLISAPFTYQPETVETFDADLRRWCIYRVARVHLAKVTSEANQVAV